MDTIYQDKVSYFGWLEKIIVFIVVGLIDILTNMEAEARSFFKKLENFTITDSELSK